MAKDNTSYNKESLDDNFISRLMEEKLSDTELRTFSKENKNEDLWADAIEGLDQYSSMERAHRQAFELNQKLTQQLKQKKNYKKNNSFTPSITVWIAIIVILLLVFLAFHLIRLRG